MSERANPSPKQASVQLLGASIRSRMAQWTGPGRLKPLLLHPNHRRTLQRIQHRNSSCNLYSHLFETSRRFNSHLFPSATRVHKCIILHSFPLFFSLCSFVKKHFSYQFTKLLYATQYFPTFNTLPIFKRSCMNITKFITSQST